VGSLPKPAKTVVIREVILMSAMRGGAFAVLACALLPAASWAQGTAGANSSSKATSFRLSNGLRVHIEEDHRLPLVATTMAFAAGGAREAPGRYGYAHLLEHLLFMETAHIRKSQHDTALESVGAVENGTTDFDVVWYYAIAPSAELETVFWLESDRMGFLVPALTPERLQSAKESVLNELNERVTGVPYSRAEQRLYELAFPAPHPYFGFVLGNPDDIRAATIADLGRFCTSYYAPANSVLVLVGDVTPTAVRPLLEKYFGNLPGGRRLPAIAPTSISRDMPAREVLEDEVSATRVTFGWRVPGAFDPSGEDVTLDILAVLLGDARLGLLPKHLVRDRQLLSEARCTYGRNRVGGMFSCDLTLRDRVEVAQVEAEFDRLLGELGREPPAAGVAAAGVAWRADQLRKQENMLERSRRLAWYAVVAGDAAHAVRDAAAHAKVTPASIGRVVTAHLPAGKRYTIVVNPRRKP
jgi:zinc protease